MKKGINRLSSMPLEITENEPIQPRGFYVRKSQTLQTKTTENIILISPPQSFEVWTVDHSVQIVFFPKHQLDWMYVCP